MKALELENYGVQHLSFDELQGVEGGRRLPSWKQMKDGAVWAWEKAKEVCVGNCVASFIEGFVDEISK